MQNSTDLSYAAELVRALAYERFLLTFFAPKEAREAIFALYSLEAEMVHVRTAVTEEIHAHMRYAWWEESLKTMATGGSARAHPVLQSLSACDFDYGKLIERVQCYRAALPNFPEDMEAPDHMALDYLRTHHAGKEAPWLRAKHTIDAHRKRHGPRRRAWLKIKLLAA